MVSVPERSPTTVGVNVIPMAHVCLAPTLDAQVLLETAKSPVAATAEMAKATFRALVKVTVLAALVLPTAGAANARAAGETVAGAEPVPVRLTVCGLFVALSTNVSVPVMGPMD